MTRLIRGASAALLALALIACSREEPRPGAHAPAPAAPVAVRVAPVARARTPLTVETVGTIQSRARSVVSSRIVATVVAVRVVEGQRVEPGDLLVSLDDRDIVAQRRRAEAAVREARAALEEVDRSIRAAGQGLEAARTQADLARTTLDRYTALRERRAVAPQEYDEVQARARAAATEAQRLEEVRASLLARRESIGARAEQAEAELAAAAVLVGHAALRAPFAGVVASKTVEVGNTASPGIPLLTLEEERYRLEVPVEESLVQSLRRGQTATVVVDALGLRREARVVEILPTADPASRSVLVRFEVPGAPGLRSGLYGRAIVTVGEREAVTVPRTALFERGQLEAVFVAEAGNAARLRLVKSGKALDDRVEILSGLAAGERVVVEGVARLTDGAAIEPRE